MITFEGISDAATQINAWFWTNKASLPEAVAAQIEPLLGQTRSPVDAAVKTAEIAYANRDLDLPAEFLELAAAAAVLTELHGFHGMDLEARGTKMSMALRRDSGEQAAPSRPWPAKESDPPYKNEYKPQPEVGPEANGEPEAPAGK